MLTFAPTLRVDFLITLKRCVRHYDNNESVKNTDQRGRIEAFVRVIV